MPTGVPFEPFAPSRGQRFCFGQYPLVFFGTDSLQNSSFSSRLPFVVVGSPFLRFPPIASGKARRNQAAGCSSANCSAVDRRGGLGQTAGANGGRRP